MQASVLVVLVLLLVPSAVLAEPEVLLTLGGGEPIWNAGAPPVFAPPAATFPAHEGEVHHVPTCDGAIGTALSPPQDHRAQPRRTVVRFLKRRLPDATCEVEVLMVRPRFRGASNAQRSPASRTPTNLSRIDPMSLPCGTEIVEVRDAGTDGSIGGVRGRGPTGECPDEADRSPPMPTQMPDSLAALTDSEFLLTISEPSAWHNGQPPPDAITLPVHEGDVVPLPSCYGGFGITMAIPAPSPEAGPSSDGTSVIASSGSAGVTVRQRPDGTCEAVALKVRRREVRSLLPVLSRGEVEAREGARPRGR